MTAEEEGDFTQSSASYPDCVHAPSAAGGEHLPATQTKQVGLTGEGGWEGERGEVGWGGEGGVWINSTSTWTKRKWREKTFEAR